MRLRRLPAEPITSPAPRPVVSNEAPVPTAHAPTLASPQEFGIAVGTFLDRARADSELTRISGASGIVGRVTAVRHEGAVMYAVILGAFSNRGAAEHKASELVTLGTVDEARILARPTGARR